MMYDWVMLICLHFCIFTGKLSPLLNVMLLFLKCSTLQKYSCQMKFCVEQCFDWQTEENKYVNLIVDKKYSWSDWGIQNKLTRLLRIHTMLLELVCIENYNDVHICRPWNVIFLSFCFDSETEVLVMNLITSHPHRVIST